MTASDWMVQNSTLDIAEAGVHLVNPSSEGGGETIILPIDSIQVNTLSHSHIIDIDDGAIEVIVDKKEHTVDISEDITVIMENNDKEVDSVCS